MRSSDMIKTIDLIAQAFDETNKLLIELYKQKTFLTNELYKKLIKMIKQNCYYRIKQIRKQYPLAKEIDKYLNES